MSGFLKQQHVDIGSRVKRGELLAELEVPELVQELAGDEARLKQSEAEVVQAEAIVASRIAERNAAQAYVAQMEAGVKRSASERQLSEKQYKRIHDLNELGSIDAGLVDEKLDHLQSAQASELSARSAVETAKQQVAAAEARIGHAKADSLVAQAKLDVAKTEISKTQAMLSYTRILAPYDGIITRRTFHLGAFIRSADQGEEVPLLCVDRTDLMRVVVKVPDRDVPFVQPGDPSIVRFDALPKKQFNGRVARISASEDPDSRSMRVEIDVPNTEGTIRDGMYGQVEIELEAASDGVTIPSGCLVGDAGTSRAKVFVVDDQSKVHLVEVKTGKDTGAFVEVEAGLTTNSQVVVKPPVTLADGATVRAVLVPAAKTASH